MYGGLYAFKDSSNKDEMADHLATTPTTSSTITTATATSSASHTTTGHTCSNASTCKSSGQQD